MATPVFNHGFTGDAGVFVLGDDGVEHGIGNLVGDLVGMAFGDGLGGKEEYSLIVRVPVIDR